MIITIAPPRGSDIHGQGHYGAPRGSRKHNGEDAACWPNSKVGSLLAGRVSKIGTPYRQEDNKPHRNKLRYIQITTVIEMDTYHLRYFYVEPMVQVSQTIAEGDIIGSAQDLRPIYPEMTPHVHFEVKKNGVFIDPKAFISWLESGVIQ